MQPLYKTLILADIVATVSAIHTVDMDLYCGNSKTYGHHLVVSGTEDISSREA